MSRQTRIDLCGLLHHVIIRGIERREIFKEKEDYQDFLLRLQNSLEDCGVSRLCRRGEEIFRENGGIIEGVLLKQVNKLNNVP